MPLPPALMRLPEAPYEAEQVAASTLVMQASSEVTRLGTEPAVLARLQPGSLGEVRQVWRRLQVLASHLEAARTGRLPAPPTLLPEQAEPEGEAIHEAAIMWGQCSHVHMSMDTWSS